MVARIERAGVVNVAVVGLGWWGCHIIERFSTLTESPIRVHLAVEKIPDKSLNFVRRHKLEIMGDYERALDRSDIDAVILTTPHGQHEEQVIQAATAGKHVFCEKPLTLSQESAQRMVTCCNGAKVVLGIGHERRVEPAMLALRKLVDDGTLGTILHVESAFSHDKLADLPVDDWRAAPEHGPAVAMTGMGIHLTDSWIQMFGPVEQVFAERARRVTALSTGDVVCVQARFASGMTGFLSALLVTPFFMRYHVFGSLGWAQVIDTAHPDSSEHTAQLTVHTRAGKRWLENYEGIDAVVVNLETFAMAVLGQTEYPVPTEELIQNIAVLDAIGRSFESGQAERVY